HRTLVLDPGTQQQPKFGVVAEQVAIVDFDPRVQMAVLALQGDAGLGHGSPRSDPSLETGILEPVWADVIPWRLDRLAAPVRGDERRHNATATETAGKPLCPR